MARMSDTTWSKGTGSSSVRVMWVHTQEPGLTPSTSPNPRPVGNLGNMTPQLGQNPERCYDWATMEEGMVGDGQMDKWAEATLSSEKYKIGGPQKQEPTRMVWLWICLYSDCKVTG